jgi:hypothetical protein
MRMTAPVPLRLFLRVRDCAAYRSKKVSEGPGFRHFSRVTQSEDRQPDDSCAERPFHNDERYCFDSSPESHQPIATRVFGCNSRIRTLARFTSTSLRKTLQPRT